MTSLLRALVVMLSFTACGSTASPPEPTAATSTSSTTVVVTIVPRVEQFAFVRAIDESGITYDPATMLTGEAAVDAARADGVLAEGEALPNDYYISNPEPDEVLAPLDPDGGYVLIGFDGNGALADRLLTLADLVAVLNGANTGEFYGIIPGEVPMILTLEGDTVVAGRQQYLP